VVAIAKRSVDAFETPRQVSMQRLAHRLATHVTAVSEEVAASSVALGVPRSRITVIPNGVDVARFDGLDATSEGLGLPARPASIPLIGSIGCLAPRKDYGTLIAALAKLADRGRDFRFVLAGDGPDRPELEAESRAAGLGSRLTFLGERDDVDRLLPALDVFTLSSREEGIPNALLEAMAAARACVVTRVGGNAEVLEDGRTGWLVPPQDPEALAAALESALSDPGEARARGCAAREAMIRDRSIAVMVRRHEAFYRRTLGWESGGVAIDARGTL
jgi:glycosyltransferase involved in cell wall biosynthesis